MGSPDLTEKILFKKHREGASLVSEQVKNLTAFSGDTGPIPGPGGPHAPWSNWALLTAFSGDTGPIPGPGGPHAPWSNWALVPQLLSLCSTAESHALQSLSSSMREATTMRSPCPMAR